MSLKLIKPPKIPAPAIVAEFDGTALAASSLDQNSSPALIKGFLNMLVEANLDQIEVEMLINKVQQATKLSKGILKSKYKQLSKASGSFLPDQAMTIARSVLASAFNEGEHLKRSPDGAYWKYTGTHWTETSDHLLKKLLLVEAEATYVPVGGKGLSAIVSEAKRCLDAESATDDDVMGFSDDPAPVVNCLNGEVWIDAEGKPELRQHQPKTHLTYCLPIEYDPDASCVLYDSTLLEIFSNAQDPLAMASHWNEFMGYAIQPVRDLASFWLLIGHGSNGKTKLVETLQHLLGPDAVLNDQISSFQRDRFNAAALVGKLVFIDDDLSENVKLDDGLLKKISEGKEISARHAYGRRKIAFRSLALPVLVGNNFPLITDNSHGMVRRAQVIPFERVFGGDEADPALFPAIWNKELPGILNRALGGLYRLRDRRQFATPNDCVRAQKEFFINANPLHAYLDARCIQDSAARLRLQDMKNWVKDQGIRNAPTDNTLKRKLTGMNFKISKVDGRNTVFGLGLKET